MNNADQHLAEIRCRVCTAECKPEYKMQVILDPGALCPKYLQGCTVPEKLNAAQTKILYGDQK